MGLLNKDKESSASEQDRKIAELRSQKKEKWGAQKAKPASQQGGRGATQPAGTSKSGSTPPTTQAGAGSNASPGMRTYKVVKGDTLSAIAERELGKAGSWKHIYDVNRDTIKDPDKIFPGQELRIPME